jgi:hypothetical protein
MNELLRAYGNFDVSAGTFSFFSELKVKEGRIDGYIKPLFKDMKVYDKRQDKHKTVSHKLYEHLVGGLAWLLENRHDEVATRAEISGPASSPGTSTWQVVGHLIENAFFHAILPGFDEELARTFHRKAAAKAPARIPVVGGKQVPDTRSSRSTP